MKPDPDPNPNPALLLTFFCPLHAEAFQLVDQLVDLQRLCDVSVHAGLQGLSLSSSKALAENAKIFSLSPPGSFRMMDVASYPFITGIWTSIRTKS